VTKHTIVNFQLARSGVALVAGGGLVMAGLLAGAGYMAGRASSPPPKPAAPPPARPSAPAPAAPPAAKKAPPPAELFSLRAGTAGSEEEAKALQAKLKAKGIASAIVALPPDSGGVVIYSVESGQYASRREAADAAAALAEKTGVRTVVVPVPATN